MDKHKQLLNFFFEVGQLKRIPRSGWVALGVKNPESVADHTARSVFISFVIAKLERADPYKAALINAFHELPETRVGDINRVGSRYLNKDEAEKKALKDQLNYIPEDIGAEFKKLISDFGKDTSKEQIIARDADYLECAIQGKEYIDQGFSYAQNWIDNSRKCVKTKTAKKFFDLLNKSNSQDWFNTLKKIKR